MTNLSGGFLTLLASSLCRPPYFVSFSDSLSIFVFFMWLISLLWSWSFLYLLFSVSQVILGNVNCFSTLYDDSVTRIPNFFVFVHSGLYWYHFHPSSSNPRYNLFHFLLCNRLDILKVFDFFFVFCYYFDYLTGNSLGFCCIFILELMLVPLSLNYRHFHLLDFVCGIFLIDFDGFGTFYLASFPLFKFYNLHRFLFWALKWMIRIFFRQTSFYFFFLSCHDRIEHSQLCCTIIK